MNGFIKVEEKPNWSELKKTIQVSGASAITEDGLVVDGIEVIERENVFEIEI